MAVLPRSALSTTVLNILQVSVTTVTAGKEVKKLRNQFLKKISEV